MNKNNNVNKSINIPTTLPDNVAKGPIRDTIFVQKIVDQIDIYSESCSSSVVIQFVIDFVHLK